MIEGTHAISDEAKGFAGDCLEAMCAAGYGKGSEPERTRSLMGGL